MAGTLVLAALYQSPWACGMSRYYYWAGAQGCLCSCRRYIRLDD